MIDSQKILSHCTCSGSKRQCRLDASFIIYSLAVHNPTYYRLVASPAEDYESRESVEWQERFPVIRDSCIKNTSSLPAGIHVVRSLTLLVTTITMTVHDTIHFTGLFYRKGSLRSRSQGHTHSWLVSKLESDPSLNFKTLMWLCTQAQ